MITRTKIINTLQNNPAWIDIINDAHNFIQQSKYKMFEWYNVHTSPATLNKMVYSNILDIKYKTHSSTTYIMPNYKLIQECIDDIEISNNISPEQNTIPDNLFNDIVSHNLIKHIIQNSLSSYNPVHIMLVGPPATAKSLFLSDLSKLPNSKYVLGSTTSKAGLVDYLLDYHPKYLIIDELEKMLGRDYATLLSLMENGVVTRLKHGMNEKTKIKTWVFAGVNTTNKIPPEILSRFFVHTLPEYTRTDFIEISNFLLNKENIKDIYLRQFIIKSVFNKTKDVRDIIKVARLCHSQSDVEKIYLMQ